MTKNYRLIISYDGTRYLGWEHQPGTDMTIQGKIENVLFRMHNWYIHQNDEKTIARGGEISHEADLTDVPEVIGAGRTDAGVHAENMVANVRLDIDMSCDMMRDYLNRYLPDDICIKDVQEAGDRFHSRYNARGKTYRYRCYVGDTKPIFDRKYVYDLGTEIINGRFKRLADNRRRELEKTLGVLPDNCPDIEKMRQAAEILMGEHDFRSFCSNPKMKKSTVRLVDRIDIKLQNDYLILTYHGTGFLQYMVRILTGTLLEVGFGKREPDSMTELLLAKDRRLAGDTAPACGLTMMKVDY